jgi:hypothetical protein
VRTASRRVAWRRKERYRDTSQEQVVDKIVASVTDPNGSKQTIEMPTGEIHEVSSKCLTEAFSGDRRGHHGQAKSNA